MNSRFTIHDSRFFAFGGVLPPAEVVKPGGDYSSNYSLSGPDA